MFFLKKNNAPAFLIIGAQKCGTSALHKYLSLHPRIVSPKGKEKKELHFFDFDERYNKGISFYHSMFPNLKNKQITFDATPSYIFHKHVPKRIHEYNKEIKMICILRNPVERAFSAWQMYKRNYEKDKDWLRKYVAHLGVTIRGNKRNEESYFSFHAFIEEEIDAASMGEQLIDYSALERGQYAKQLRNYYNFFRKEQIFICNTHDLRSRTKEVLDEIQQFLEIESYSYKPNEIVPLFEGNYCDVMEEKTRHLLDNYYKSHNRELFDLLHIDYGW